MEERKNFIINSLYFAIIFGLIYLGINYLLPILLPFIIGFFFAYFAYKISTKLLKKNSKLYKALSLLGIYIGIIAIICISISLGINRITQFIQSMPTIYRQIIEPALSQSQKELMELNNRLPNEVKASLQDAIGSLFEALRTLLSSGVSVLATFATSVITNAPSFFVSLIIEIISSFYFLFDYENIRDWFIKVSSTKEFSILSDIKDFIEGTLIKILGSYGLIMFITFIELFIGLLLFRVSNAGLWSLLIAVLDILPVLGVGTVLIPWGLIALISGNTLLGVEIIVLYLIITVIRNILEPKLVGADLGLKPLATLISMIVGLRIFGVIGMFGFPLTISFFVLRKKKQSA